MASIAGPAFGSLSIVLTAGATIPSVQFKLVLGLSHAPAKVAPVVLARSASNVSVSVPIVASIAGPAFGSFPRIP